MGTVTFDTLKYVKQLESAGVPSAHAEAFANAQREILAEALDSSLATKADLTAVRSDLKAEIVALRADMQAIELRLTVKLGAFIAVAAGIIIAVVRLPH